MSGEIPTAEGAHDRATYTALVARLHLTAAGGKLEVRSGDEFVTAWFVAGFPVLVQGTPSELDLLAQLQEAGLLRADHVAELRPSDPSALDLLDRELVEAERLREHQVRLLDEGLTWPLRWPEGSWTWTERDALPSSLTRRTVLADGSPLRALLAGVKAHVPPDDAQAFVSDPSAGAFRPTLALGGALAPLTRGTALAGLKTRLASASGWDDLLSIYRPFLGELVPLLWLLELGGLLEREGNERRPDLSRVERPVSRVEGEGRWAGRYAQSRPGRAAPDSELDRSLDTSQLDESDFGTDPGRSLRPRTNPGRRRRSTAGRIITSHELSEAVARDYDKRMRQDYYSFLGLKPSAPAAVVEKACNRLSRRWNKAARTAEMGEERREMARELLTSVRLIWRTLGDPERRTEYDRRLSRGQPPLIEPIRAADITHITLQTADRSRDDRRGLDNLLQAARDAMEQSDWQRALGLLHKARQQHPDEPDVLAELGWATWFAGNRSDEATEKCEEYLQLSRAFHPAHAKTQEYLARLAIARKDHDVARRRLSSYLRKHPDAKWARQALEALPEAPKPGQSKGGFWRR